MTAGIGALREKIAGWREEIEQKCTNSKVFQVAKDVFESTVVTARALSIAVHSTFVSDAEERNRMEYHVLRALNFASNIFKRTFGIGGDDPMGIVAPCVKETLYAWIGEILLGLPTPAQKWKSRGIFALSIIALAVAHIADAIIGVTAGLLSLGTGRQYSSLNQVADKAFCGWTGIVRDIVFCALRVLRPNSRVNPLAL